MIHASVELVEAMRGVGGWQDGIHNSPPDCNSEGAAVFAWKYGPPNDTKAVEDHRAVNCPACLRLMREATDPVRWDALEERGLAPKLEAA